MTKPTLQAHHAKLLAGLTFAAAKQLARETLCVDENNRLRKWKMWRRGDIALIDQAADEIAPRAICVYHVDPQDIDPASGLAESGVRFKIDPTRLLFALRWLHNGNPPDFNLSLARDPKLWFTPVLNVLIGALQEADPGLRSRLVAAAAE